MTEQDKQLLVKDLSARVPYNPYIFIKEDNVKTLLTSIEVDKDEIVEIWYNGIPYSIEDIKPYLRPLSSMTVEERLYFHRNSSKVHILVDAEKIITKPFYGYTIHLLDWLNKHHFDYRGLIYMGLALEAPENMYKVK